MNVARGISLHIGLNSVDPQHYAGWGGQLTACENDARDMAEIARLQHFSTTILRTRDARAGRVLTFIRDAARTLKGGDIFLLTFAGHGSQIPDLNGDEPDKLDETLVLYDRMLSDDELAAEFDAFADGVRIVQISDSCHSGSVHRRPGVVRLMPTSVSQETFQQHRKLYENIQRKARDRNRGRQHDLLLLSACQDKEVAADGDQNGLFTGVLKSVWRNGLFAGSYLSFWQRIDRQMPSDQNPNLVTTGPHAQAFSRERPFSITPTRSPRTKENTMTTTYPDTTDTTDGWPDIMAELGKRVPIQSAGESAPTEVVPASTGDDLDDPGRFPVPEPNPRVVTRGGAEVRVFWWGFHVELDHDTLESALNSGDTVNSLVGTIGGAIPSPAQPWIVLIAKFVAGAHALLRILDQGNGLYISMSWFAPGIFVPTTVRGGRGSRSAPTRGEPVAELTDFPVNESDHDVDTGLYLERGQRVIISATGEIKSGVLLAGFSGPQGWVGWRASKDSPLAWAPPFSLLARLDGRYVPIGIGKDFVYRGRGSKLSLRINDDWPGNGEGAFLVSVEVYAP